MTAAAPTPSAPRVAVIGGGPAGLMAAEILATAGVAVTVHDRMPSLGRKLLMAGRGGLNLTHSEPLDAFVGRYGEAAGRLAPLIEAFPPAALTAWTRGLGQETFVGSSGRVFPKALKASPLLRAWLARLTGLDVTFRLGETWEGWDASGALMFRGADGAVTQERPNAVVLALGGASWARLGSDGTWAPMLAAAGVALTPFAPANSGFKALWSPAFAMRFAGQPLKGVALTFQGQTVRGEAVITRDGLEGGAVYALSAALRDAIARDGSAWIGLDLRPDETLAKLAARLDRPGRGDSLANRLRKALNLAPVAANLLREGHGRDLPTDPALLAATIKATPIHLTAPQALDRAISTAGGVALEAVDEGLMLTARPGVFAAGEMLGWEAPTGGYLLQACFATGVAAAEGVLAWLAHEPSSPLKGEVAA